jgi:tetratricopeptide (TPR) repeat protein
MSLNNKTKYNTGIGSKIGLIVLGIAIFFVALEIILRAGGYILMGIQERRNLQSVRSRGACRIVCLGESTTAGGQDSYPSQLEGILNRGDTGITFSVINKGQPAVTTSYLVEQLQSCIDRYHPDIVISMMGINDYDSNTVGSGDRDIRQKINEHVRSYRVYRLADLIWRHAIDRVKKIRLSLLKTHLAASRLLVQFPAESNKSSSDDDPVDRGFVCRQKGELSAAQKYFESALSLNPDNAKAYRGLAEVYTDRKQYEKALEYFNRAIDLEPSDYHTYAWIGWIYTYTGKNSLADEFFQKAIDLGPQDDWFYLELGLYYYINYPEKFSQAEIVLRRAIQFNPRNDMAYFGLGWIYAFQNKYDESEEAFRKALELNPSNDRAAGGLNVLYGFMRADHTQEGRYCNLVNEIRSEHYNTMTRGNYQHMKSILDVRGIPLVCVQYPIRSIEPLKAIFGPSTDIIFVDNEKVFKDAVEQKGYRYYFIDMFGGDFGHCTAEGNRLLADNISRTLFDVYFKGAHGKSD